MKRAHASRLGDSTSSFQLSGCYRRARCRDSRRGAKPSVLEQRGAHQRGRQRGDQSLHLADQRTVDSLLLGYHLSRLDAHGKASGPGPARPGSVERRHHAAELRQRVVRLRRSEPSEHLLLLRLGEQRHLLPLARGADREQLRHRPESWRIREYQPLEIGALDRLPRSRRQRLSRLRHAPRRLERRARGADRHPSLHLDNQASNSIDYIGSAATIHSLFTNPTSFVSNTTNQIFQFNGSAVPSTIQWPNGASETTWDYGTTRSINISTGSCEEYFVDYEIPLAMLNAAAFGGPTLDQYRPFQFLFTTANSLNNPFQKDVVWEGNFVCDATAPGPFGDAVQLSTGLIPQPISTSITAGSAVGCNVPVVAQIMDALTVNNCSSVSQLVQVQFKYYYDINGNGLDDDGGTWVNISDPTVPVGTTVAANWNLTNLIQGQYLIALEITDNRGHTTQTWMGKSSATLLQPFGTDSNGPGGSTRNLYTNVPPINPTFPYVGLEASTLGVNYQKVTIGGACGAPPPTVTKTHNVASVQQGQPVTFTLTLSNTSSTDRHRQLHHRHAAERLHVSEHRRGHDRLARDLAERQRHRHGHLDLLARGDAAGELHAHLHLHRERRHYRRHVLQQRERLDERRHADRHRHHRRDREHRGADGLEERGARVRSFGPGHQRQPRRHRALDRHCDQQLADHLHQRAAFRSAAERLHVRQRQPVADLGAGCRRQRHRDVERLHARRERRHADLHHRRGGDDRGLVHQHRNRDLDGSGDGECVGEPVRVGTDSSAITKVGNYLDRRPDDTISFTVVVREIGNATATLTYLGDTIPTGYTFVPGSSSANCNAQNVISATVTSGGTGYTSAPTVSFSGGGGTGATATAVLTGTTVTSIVITNPGNSNYTSTPTISFSGGGGSGAAATAVVGVACTSLGSLTAGTTATRTLAFSIAAGAAAVSTEPRRSTRRMPRQRPRRSM